MQPWWDLDYWDRPDCGRIDFEKVWWVEGGKKWNNHIFSPKKTEPEIRITVVNATSNQIRSRFRPLAGYSGLQQAQ